MSLNRKEFIDIRFQGPMTDIRLTVKMISPILSE